MTKLSYINEDGNVVFTSQSLRNKKSCCKSTCLHCPYGTTLDRFGVQIKNTNEFDSDVVKSLKNELIPKSSLGSSLFSEAFGKSEDLSESDLYILTLKDIICGLCYIKDKKLQKLHLKTQFSDQGITESYLIGLINS